MTRITQAESNQRYKTAVESIQELYKLRVQQIELSLRCDFEKKFLIAEEAHYAMRALMFTRGAHLVSRMLRSA